MRGGVLEDRGQGLDRGQLGERMFPGQHFVEDDAQREDVAPAVHRDAPGLLGRHVIDRAHDHALGGHPRLGQGGLGGFRSGQNALGDAEVHDLGVALRRAHDVGRLEVAVDDALGMGDFQSFGDFQSDLEGVAARRSPLPSFYR